MGTLTKSTVKAAIDRFEEAVRAHAWKGSQHPLDVPGIEAEYQDAKARLEALLARRS